MFAVDEAHDVETLSSYLSSLLPSYSRIYMDTPKQPSPRRRSILTSLTAPTLSTVDSALSKVAASKVQPLSSEMHQLRKFKSPVEIDLMRKSADISGNAHAKVETLLTLYIAQLNLPSFLDNEIYETRNFWSSHRGSLWISLCVEGFGATGICSRRRVRSKRPGDSLYSEWLYVDERWLDIDGCWLWATVSDTKYEVLSRKY